MPSYKLIVNHSSEMMTVKQLLSEAVSNPSLFFNDSFLEVLVSFLSENIGSVNFSIEPATEDLLCADLMSKAVIEGESQEGRFYLFTQLYMLLKNTELLKQFFEYSSTRIKVYRYIFALDNNSHDFEFNFLTSGKAGEWPSEYTSRMCKMECEYYKFAATLFNEVVIDTRADYIKLVKNNKELLQSIKKMKKQPVESKVVEKVIEKVVDNPEDKAEIDRLTDEVYNLQYQLDVLKSMCSDRGLPATVEDAEMEMTYQEHESVDLSKYRIMVVTGTQHSNAFDYECVDIDKRPKTANKLRYADVIVYDTKHISHGAYWKAREVAITYGIKSLHFGKRDKVLLDAMLDNILCAK